MCRAFQNFTRIKLNHRELALSKASLIRCLSSPQFSVKFPSEKVKDSADMIQAIDLANAPILIESLERQEFEASVGVPSAEVYTKLLALYLLQHDLCNAKFLWKRTPQSIKLSHPEIGHVWEVGKHLWNGNYPSIYSNLRRTWSDDISYIMKALQDEVQKRAISLISKAYSSLPNSALSEFLGVSEEEALKIAQSEGWTVDKVYTQPIRKPEEYSATNISDTQLYILTKYVSFLEN